MAIKILWALVIILCIIFVLLCLSIIYNEIKRRIKKRHKKFRYPFKKTIYKFKLSHQCTFCKDLTFKKKLIFAPTTNHDGVLIDDTIQTGFHVKCLKHVLVEPEKYSTEQLSLAVYLPEYLIRQQQKERAEKEREEKDRQEFIEKAKEANLALFIDESTGRIKVEENK